MMNKKLLKREITMRMHLVDALIWRVDFRSICRDLQIPYDESNGIFVENKRKFLMNVVSGNELPYHAFVHALIRTHQYKALELLPVDPTTQKHIEYLHRYFTLDMEFIDVMCELKLIPYEKRYNFFNWNFSIIEIIDKFVNVMELFTTEQYELFKIGLIRCEQTWLVDGIFKHENPFLNRHIVPFTVQQLTESIVEFDEPTIDVLVKMIDFKSFNLPNLSADDKRAYLMRIADDKTGQLYGDFITILEKTEQRRAFEIVTPSKELQKLQDELQKVLKITGELPGDLSDADVISDEQYMIWTDRAMTDKKRAIKMLTAISHFSDEQYVKFHQTLNKYAYAIGKKLPLTNIFRC